MITLSDQTPEENAERSSTEIEKKEPSSKSLSRFFKKLMDWVNVKFSNVFSASHWIYTILFFAGAVFLAILRFFSGSMNIGLFAATTLLFTFLLLFCFASINKTAPYILEGPIKRRAIMFVIFLAASLGLVILLWYELDYLKTIPENYYLFQEDTTSGKTMGMLTIIYIFVFFLWNVIQVYYLVKGIDGISSKAEAKIFGSNITPEQKLSRGMTWLVVGIVVPIGVQVVILLLLFLDNSGTAPMIGDPQGLGQIIFAVWFGAICLMLVAASLNAFRLYKQTVKHDTPSVLLSFTHMIFIVYVLYRGYQFINSVGKYYLNTTSSGSASDQYIDEAINTILLILALLLLFQGLGSKISKLSLFSRKNVPFFAYMLATVFIMGQVALLILLQGFKQSDTAIVSALNNMLMMAVSMIYYYIYLKRKLMQGEYLERDNYSSYEIQGMFNQYTSMLLNEFSSMDAAKVNDKLKEFLQAKEIAMTKEPVSAPAIAPPPIHVEAPAPIKETAEAPTPAEEKSVEDEKEASPEPDDDDEKDSDKEENDDTQDDVVDKNENDE